MRERMKQPFLSIDDLHHRVPELRKDEMRKLAAVGALNFIQTKRSPKSKVPRKSNVQSQKSKVKDKTQIPNSKFKAEDRTLDIGHWTLDRTKPDQYLCARPLRGAMRYGRLNEWRDRPENFMKNFMSRTAIHH